MGYRIKRQAVIDKTETKDWWTTERMRWSGWVGISSFTSGTSWCLYAINNHFI